MRSERFDRLIRIFATRHTRRQFLTGFAVAATAGRVTPPFTPAATAEAVCPSEDARTICPGALDHSAIASQLLHALPANSNTNCLPGNTPCDRDDVCCSGVCTMHGRCGCFETGHLCPSDGYCCGGSCVNGRCT
jgi:hypothetical protein